MNTSEPMRQVSNEWDATRYCPCGSTFTWTDAGTGVSEWTLQHKHHSNGTLIEQAGDDWAKVYASKPNPRITNI